MKTELTRTLDAALKLWAYLSKQHLADGGLVGPDPGVRWNYRIGRFVKSYLGVVPWHDNLCYMQGQGYWVLANWRLYWATGRADFRDAAIAASELLLRRQRSDGAWDYPNPEWRGRVATVEGAWASLALMETFRFTKQPRFSEGVARWDQYLEREIGFQRLSIGTAVNYFAGAVDDPVPNNTALLLRYCAAQALSGCRPLERGRASDLVRLLRCAQSAGGEIAYQIAGDGRPLRPHFQCFQYNAFILMDLFEYFELTEDEEAYDLLIGLRRFLQQGVGRDGRAFYACADRTRAVTYHAAALAAALATASTLDGAGVDDALRERLTRFVFDRQRSDGSFPHSTGEYAVLSDRRAYPRYLAMILFHLTILHERCGALRERTRSRPLAVSR